MDLQISEDNMNPLWIVKADEREELRKKEAQRKMAALQMKVQMRKSADNLIEAAEIIDAYATQYNLRNEQWFIDWQDKLNEISVR